MTANRKVLRLDRYFPSTRPVASPSAQTNSLCGVNEDPKGMSSTILTVLEQLKVEGGHLYYVLLLQYQYGLRVSEALNLRCSQISKGGKILVNGSKGSADRIIVVPELARFGANSLVGDYKIFPYISRFHVYREYKKRGISLALNGTNKRAVTHAPRHVAINEVNELSKSKEKTRQFIGHKSIKSTEHYVRNKKNKNSY
tara:strand:- start:414 stop:1010 length:597 start_codon:yes stop_codon:yes gene_type:complete